MEDVMSDKQEASRVRVNIPQWLMVKISKRIDEGGYESISSYIRACVKRDIRKDKRGEK